MKSVSEDLRLGRLKRRLTQVELAARVGFSTATLCRIEKGDKLPSADEIQAIAKALGADSAESNEAEVALEVAYLAQSRKRLRIELQMEELSAVIAPGHQPNRWSVSSTGASPVVLYVDLNQLEDPVQRETESAECETESETDSGIERHGRHERDRG